MKKLWITLVCVCVLAVSGYGQFQIKNNHDTTVMQVTSEGKVEIADSLTVRALENTSSDESSLVGVDKNGTLTKADQTMAQDGLIFFPVGTLVVDNWENATIAGDTMNAVFDIGSAAGITIPDAATHVLIKAHVDMNLIYPPEGYAHNVALRLFADDEMPADNWSETTTPLPVSYRELMVSHIDGSADRFAIESSGTGEERDWHGSDEVQDSGNKIVRLSDTKTIAYRLKPYLYGTTPNMTVDSSIASLGFSLILEGYYIPLSALINHQ
jgi:hypothetical protein